ncbi:MAG TPA: hypothetical protein VD998_03270, partial [Verrucomicrobiae bacterium]|nr:hypothetical protein [Verrucomicrobiae bacterium]
MREKGCEAIASNLASLVRDRLEVGADPIGVVLGTGWGDRLPLDDPRELSFSEISQFRKLRGLEGHARKFVA